MPSRRTELDRAAAGRWARFDPRGRGGRFQRLTPRPVLALAVGAPVRLVGSGVAINHNFPGCCAEQTRERIQTSAVSTGILLRQEISRRGEAQANAVAAAEVRDVFIVPEVAEDAAFLFNATVTIANSNGDVLAVEEPPDIKSLEAQGLRRDTEVGPFEARVDVDLPDGTITRYQVLISDPFSTREETLSQIQGALVGAGVLALLASLVTGIIAARSLTVPISRLRGVAGRVAQGQLDERAVPSGVLEIDELGQQFNVMADRLAGTLRMLEADRDRLREFVADVSHELRTPIAALRMYTELQRDGEVDEATRREFLDRSLDQIQRLDWLSTNLLDLSRIDAGIYPLDMRTGDLRDPVQAVVQALSEAAVERGVALESTVPGEDRKSVV